MRALVTGCAGFIGSHLTEALLDRGDTVIGIDCFNDNYGRRQKLANLRAVSGHDGFEFVPIDLARGDLEELVGDVQVVFHLAAEPGVRASWGARYGHFVRNNIVATQHLLDAVKARADLRLVHASSSSVYGDAGRAPTGEHAPARPLSPYGQTKLASEHLCDLYRASHGLDVVCLRLFTVFGPRQRPDMAIHRFCRSALEGEQAVVLGDGRQTRDFTYVTDVVAALLAAAQADLGDEERIINVGAGAPASILAVLELVAALTGREPAVAHLPAEAGEARDTSADISLARNRLDYAPVVSLRDGLAMQLEWLEQGAAEPAAAV